MMKSSWLNPYFAVNVDSVLNDLAMLLVCGVLKNVSLQYFASYFSTTTNAQPVAVVPECAIDSKACDDETKHGDEIDAIKNDGDVGDPLAGEAILSGVVSQGTRNDGSAAAQ